MHAKLVAVVLYNHNGVHDNTTVTTVLYFKVSIFLYVQVHIHIPVLDCCSFQIFSGYYHVNLHCFEVH